MLSAKSSVDFGEFLAQHDMMWDRIPNRWEVAPYTGNGNVGFLFYQADTEAKNVISIYTGRHDYYDHRLPVDGNEFLWIYRSRLPLGHFKIESKGDIVDVDLRLDLWNAEMVGTVHTSKGAYAVRGLSHSVTDVIYFETNASDGESIQITWHPDAPVAPVRETLTAGGGPKGGSWDKMRVAPYEMPLAPTLSEANGMQFCYQPLYQQRGETTTGWEIRGEPQGRQIMIASVHHSFPENNSLATVKQNLQVARQLLADREFFSSHQQWWHDYYPLSFLTLNDAEKEAFYWIQMYKLGSAMRENGPILDLMGPWYHKTFWPMVWGDLNVQLIYWTHLTSNRMSIGESLGNNLDKYAGNLAKNVPEHWEDSAAIAACFPQDLQAYDHSKVPDMLAWVLQNYWLHCEYAGDRERMRDGLFPLLRQTVNGYLNYMKDHPVQSDDGKIHIKHSWSPEYPGGSGQDVNFTIALLRWSCETLLAINAEHHLNDPLAPEWQNIVDNLVGWQIDDNGLRIGKDIAFEKPHRHYSHLLGFYPLALITPESDADAVMLRTTLDHWLDVSINGVQKDHAMAVTGYTATGAASMYATLGDAERAYHYLNFLIHHQNVSTTTMYAEGNPVIESPLSFATALQDMLLQSWGGKIRVFPGTPERWTDVAFEDFRTQGAFLVSAKKKAGATQFVSVESLIGSPCIVRVDIPNPKIAINGAPAAPSKVTQLEGGFYAIDLKTGDTAVLTPVALEQADLKIEPIDVTAEQRNLFGLSEKTQRLPGHQFYYPEKGMAFRPVTSIGNSGRQSYEFPAKRGRYVRVELPGENRVLSLAEVEVINGGVNIALARATQQSSDLYGGVSSRAVDGDINGDFMAGSVTHTDESTNPWWEVDLGSMEFIEKIIITNREGGNADRLNGFTLKVLDKNKNVVFVMEDVPAVPVTSFE